MSTSTEKSSQKLFETITALTAALDAAEAQTDFDRAAEIEALREQLADVLKSVPSTWPGAPAAPTGGAKAWPAEPEKQLALQKKLLSLRDQFLDLVTSDGPSQPRNHIMRKAFATTGEIVALMLLGLLGTITTLCYVIDLWPRATPRGDGEYFAEADARASGSARPAPSLAPSASSASSAPSAPSAAPAPDDDAGEGEDEADNLGAPEDPALDAGGDTAVAGSVDAGAVDAGPLDAGSVDGGPASSAKAGRPTKPRASTARAKTPPPKTELDRAIAELERVTAELDKKKRPVPERDVLTMIILLGALGGFVHLTSSLSKYVGTRKLLRSWIIYYLLMPVSGAGLAPMIYLLLRVGVLGNGAEDMNVFGLYAFAALTGLFAEQALEKLGDVFSQIFTRASETDPLDAGATKKKGT